jgi:hypothetical protein
MIFVPTAQRFTSQAAGQKVKPTFHYRTITVNCNLNQGIFTHIGEGCIEPLSAEYKVIHTQSK